MVKVPEYIPNVSLRPELQSGIDVRANAEHFGAGIGRGMGQAAQGLSNLAGSLQAVKELENQAEAKEREKNFLDWKRERMYGENGFMTLEGKNAVDGRKAFEDEVETKRREFGKGLNPGSAKVYQRVTDAHLQNTLQQSIVHTANARKTWFKEASTSRMQMFADEALVNYNNPAALQKNMAAGIAELREKGQLEGWDADTLKMRALEYASGVHKNIALRMLQDGPNSALAAEKYVKDNAHQMTGADQYDLRKTLETEVLNAKSIEGAAGFFTQQRGSIKPEGSGKPEGSNKADGPRTIGRTGPSNARAYLMKVSNKDASHIDGLEETFATNLAALMQDAPPEIRNSLGVYSGYRSTERQAQLYSDAVRKYGSPQAARRWVAPPGRSNHNHGNAVDISYNGRSLQHAPENVKRWVHENAKKYGLYFPMAHEPWHIEPMGTRGTARPENNTEGVSIAISAQDADRGFAGPISAPDGGSTVAARGNTVAYRSSLPSYDEIETYLESIPDPQVRDLTRKRIYSQMEAQNKFIEQQEKAAKAELWSYIDQGATPDDIPFQVRQMAGMAAVSSAWSYIETAAKGRAVESDETLLYDIQRFAATNPTEFAGLDLNDYRDRLSRSDIRELSKGQSSVLSDTRKANEDGATYREAYKVAEEVYTAAGIKTGNSSAAQSDENKRRIAMMNNAMRLEVQQWMKLNEGKTPGYEELRTMAAMLAMKAIATQPRGDYNPLRLFGEDATVWSGRLYERLEAPGGSEIKAVAEFKDIPADWVSAITVSLSRRLSRAPTKAEIEKEWAAIAMELVGAD